MKQSMYKFSFLVFIILFICCQNDKTMPAETPKDHAQLAKFQKLGMDTLSKTHYESLMVGDDAPTFSGVDQYGNEHTMESLTKDSSLVIIFYRGQWCPVCNRYLSNFAKNLDTLNQLGARVVAVAPELQEYAIKTQEETGLNIPIISDLDRSIMDAFKVTFKVTEEYQKKIIDKLQADIAEINGSTEAYLPIPATYVIGTDKKLKFVHFDPNYKSRASVKNIAKSL